MKPREPKPSVDLRKLNDAAYRQQKGLAALAELEGWCERYRLLAEVQPVIDGIHESYDALLSGRRVE